MSNDMPPYSGNGRAPQYPAGGAARPQRGPGGAVGVLHVIGGNDRGKQYQLTQPQTAIGRGADQDLILADIAVSRRHVVILIEGERYRCRDLGSGNGTLVNGVRSDTVILNDGDQIEIGNTLLRLEHPPSRAMQAPMPSAAADNRTMMADAVAYPPPAAAPPPVYPPPNAFAAPVQPMQMGSPYGTMPQPVPAPLPPPGDFPPSDAVALPYPPQRPMSQSLPAPLHTGAHPAPGGFFSSTIGKLVIFGSLFLVVGVGAAVAVKKLVLGGGDDAQKLYTEGKTLASAGDYDGAKRMFNAALAADPTFTPAAKASKQADVDAHAHTALRKANGLVAQKKWVEALQALDSIDRASEAHKEAENLRKEAVPRAVEEYLDQAKEVMKDEPEQAKAKVDSALELDPENEDALALEKQLKGAAPSAAVAAREPSSAGARQPREPRTARSSPAFEAIRDDVPTRPAHAAAGSASHAGGSSSHAATRTPPPAAAGGDDDEDLAPVGRPTGRPAAGGAAPAGGIDLLASRAGSPYRGRDFSGAVALLRGMGKPGEQLAAQVGALASSYAKAEAAKTSNVPVAVTEYEHAMTIDARIGKGTHTAYFRSQLGRLEKQLAQQAFAQGKYDVAFEASKSCAKYGSDDGGVGAQLKSKAAELNGKAAAVAKTNVNQAKTMWRMVLRMVPSNDPSYGRAAQSLNASQQSSHADEDE